MSNSEFPDQGTLLPDHLAHTQTAMYPVLLPRGDSLCQHHISLAQHELPESPCLPASTRVQK